MLVGCYQFPLLEIERPMVRLVSHQQSYPVAPTVDPVTTAPPTVVAENIVTTQTKTAVDVAAELENALKQVRADNRYLLRRLEIARDIIEQQKESMAGADFELRKSRQDLERVQSEMRDWRDRFAQLSEQSLRERKIFEQAFQRLERRLQTMLIKYTEGTIHSADQRP